MSEPEHGDKCTLKGMAQGITAKATEVMEVASTEKQSLSRGKRVFVQGHLALGVRTQAVRRMSI